MLRSDNYVSLKNMCLCVKAGESVMLSLQLNLPINVLLNQNLLVQLQGHYFSFGCISIKLILFTTLKNI